MIRITLKAFYSVIHLPPRTLIKQEIRKNYLHQLDCGTAWRIVAHHLRARRKARFYRTHQGLAKEWRRTGFW